MTTIKVYGKIRSKIIRLVQDERSKCLHIVLVYGSTAVIKTTTLLYFFLLITIMHTHKNILQKIVLTLIIIHYLQKNIYDTLLLTSLTEYDTLLTLVTILQLPYTYLLSYNRYIQLTFFKT